MGNEQSTGDEKLFLEEGESLDNPNVDKKVNMGTAPANCQPKHTRDELKREHDKDEKENGVADPEHEGLEVVVSREGNDPEVHLPGADGKKPSPAGKAEANKAGSAKKGRRGRQPPEEGKEEPKKLGYIQMAKIGYQELVNAIIRPPRADYKEEAMGPPAFNFCGRRFTRTDFTLMTKRGLALQCSHWEPVERTSDRIPVVIYMHGNSSARVEVIPQLSYLLSLGLAVFSFDFAGSGKSDGQFVSLGYYEREDLMCVIAHLRATNVVSTIALWGRSMGAATALMHGDRDPSIACMILDSSFADLTQLAEEMVEKGRDQGINVPNFVVSVAIRMIRGSVKKQANFDIRHISPITHADKCFIPALFVAGEHDDFINKRHSEAIYEKYAGDKNLIIVEGDHNSPRPKFMFDSVSIFLQTCLQIPNCWALRVHPGMNLMAPPWFFPGVPQHSGSVKARPRGELMRYGNGSRPSPSSAVPPKASDRAAKNEVDGAEIGMTLERQKEIQASLFKMLGQPDDAEKKEKPKESESESRTPAPSDAKTTPSP